MKSASKLLIYGAYGYTGRLIVQEAVKQGLEPLLSGRDREKLTDMAIEFGLEYEAMGLTDHKRLAEVLSKVDLVVHCAGPFIHTAENMAEACLKAGKHYVDITGEYEVFQRLHSFD